ncbi:hypothetical protein BOX15_Mlig034129g1 [Macrostomum lignano]|uniref:Dynein light chain n=3 Tax=Macrostomum lignano TaxID=282301 RepID=A0A1I8H6V5_9PLAT|nr:hypothetical protein BOX15_Mlig034129g1 [Macrostomum lignano]
MTDAFIDAYFAIDTEGKGEITSAQLTRYMRQNNYDEAFVRKWLKLFDSDNSGTITLDEYCQTLGLEAKKVKADYIAKMRSGSLPSDITVISSDMTLELQLRIIEIVRDGQRLNSMEKDMAKYIKQQCDAKMERLWHVVIINGQFWCWYSHEPGYSFIFRLGKYIFCIWRTPGY